MESGLHRLKIINGIRSHANGGAVTDGANLSEAEAKMRMIQETDARIRQAAARQSVKPGKAPAPPPPSNGLADPPAAKPPAPLPPSNGLADPPAAKPPAPLPPSNGLADSPAAKPPAPVPPAEKPPSRPAAPAPPAAPDNGVGDDDRPPPLPKRLDRMTAEETHLRAQEQAKRAAEAQRAREEREAQEEAKRQVPNKTEEK